MFQAPVGKLQCLLRFILPNCWFIKLYFIHAGKILQNYSVYLYVVIIFYFYVHCTYKSIFKIYMIFWNSDFCPSLLYLRLCNVVRAVTIVCDWKRDACGFDSHSGKPFNPSGFYSDTKWVGKRVLCLWKKNCKHYVVARDADSGKVRPCGTSISTCGIYPYPFYLRDTARSKENCILFFKSSGHCNAVE